MPHFWGRSSDLVWGMGKGRCPGEVVFELDPKLSIRPEDGEPCVHRTQLGVKLEGWEKGPL